ncbi:hypothetical protein KDN32_01315 [Nocardioides sp. J2M5]|uniref:mannitol dehydrogenase family protein n=1 Tax=Nocardioides palaemonis TaxID=2829810 RepID=UPI001BA4DFD0|nr:hypothetical protein [Nocardioides palaemonis]MBS2936376.1 hypothetical protein [Nocardioides palaemonis]
MAATLEADDHPYALVTRTHEAARRLSRSPVRVDHVSPTQRSTVLHPSLVLAVDDVRLSRLVGAAPVVFVAVGSGQARTLAPDLARALAGRRTPARVLVCDDRPGAAGVLRALVGEHTTGPVAAHRFAGVVVEPIAHRPGPDPDRVVVESPGGLRVDRAALRGDVPAVRGLHAVDDFTAHLTRKKFVFDAGHASAAYVGGLAGHATLPEALTDPAVEALVLEVLREGRAGVAALFGDDLAGADVELDRTLDRYRRPALADPVTRVGRDPRRQLSRGDRICGPALAALASGTVPAGLAVTAAAALTWGTGLDPSLQAPLRRTGVRGVLSQLTGLAPRHPFLALSERAHAVLTTGGSPLDALDAARSVAVEVRR